MRWLVVLAAIDVLLAFGATRPRVSTVHAVAAPLTRVPGNGLDTIDGGDPVPAIALRMGVVAAVRATGTPEQQAAARALEAPPADHRPADMLRAAVQADAIAILSLLGPARVEAMLRARPELSAAYGELQVWEELSP